MTLQTRLLLALALALPVTAACKSSRPAVGEFQALTSNLSSGDTWALNRPIQLVFNNEVDPLSVNFSSIILRARGSGAQSQPVAGTFVLGTDSQGNPGRTITFLPVCPTNDAQDNGSFLPGGVEYELLLPTQQTSATVLRDTAGHPLSTGLTRTFVTPTPPAEALFADTVNGPVQVAGIDWPQSLNLFTQEKQYVRVRLNQSYDASPSSLNLDNLFIQYTNSNGLFPVSGNVVPGTWIVSNNCSDAAELLFDPSGVLVPGRGLRLVMSTDFLDLGGSGNTSVFQSDAFLLPELADVLTDANFDPADVVLDEMRDGFLNSTGLDLEADLALPPAQYSADRISAAFDFPGTVSGADQDFTVTAAQSLLELDTTGVTEVTDGLGRVVTCANGVMSVNDFTIEAGATLRLRGVNPFVLYASGTVTILGTFDASGFNAQRPDGGRFHPELPVPGAAGALGGGAGGTSSQITDDFTPRGESGKGPFGTLAGGGQGGEGSVQQANGLGLDDIVSYVAGGGGGGGFSAGRTDAVLWNRWSGAQVPTDFDNVGPDLRSDRHTIFNATINPNTFFVGAESGVRGSNKDGPLLANSDFARAPYGMEDIQQDDDADLTTDDTIDAPEIGAAIAFRYGNPNLGPDAGTGGASVFTDSTASNNFFGQRYFWDGTAGVQPVLTEGELLTPWAGSGGGASGDGQRVLRLDLDGDMQLDPLPIFFPDAVFPYGSTTDYWRGAPGGGGGGQVQILAVGQIVLGAAGRIKANGGAGNSGESTDESGGGGETTQISGSGGGSGGHVILQSATGVNLSAIDVGTAGNPSNPATFFNNTLQADVVQAIGGRRGWAASSLAANLAGAPGSFDGNSTFMIGRGGAGASGLIQIHVPDPVNDLTFEPQNDAAFKQYVTAVNAANPVISDRLDQVLGLYGEPQPFALVPTFAAQTQMQGKWVDTGLAELRNPANGAGPFPDFASALGGFEGVVAGTGLVSQSGDAVAAGASIASDGGAGTASFEAFRMVVADASGSFPVLHLANPALLIGFDVVPNPAQLPSPSGFEVVAAEYDAAADELTLDTKGSDGSMAAVASLNWEVREKYFRIDTSSTKDRLPAGVSVRIQFQGAEAIAGTNDLDPTTITAWTGTGAATLATLKGKRFIRWRLTFDLDSAGSGGMLTAEVPTLDYLKLPFAW